MTRTRMMIAAAGLAIAFLLPYVAQGTYTQGVWISALFFAMAATALNMVSGMTGQLSIGHSGLLLLGGYTTALVAMRFDVPIVVGLIAGVLACSILSWVVAKVAMKLQPFYLGMLTLALSLVLAGLVTQWKGLTGGPDGLIGIPSIAGDDFEAAGNYALIAMALGLVVSLLLLANIKGSQFGRASEAVRVNPLVALGCGIDTARVRTQMFVVSGAVAGLAGGLFASWQSFISPAQFGVDLSLLLLLMMTVGGRGSLFGVAIAGAALSLVPEATRSLEQYSPLIYGGLLVVSSVLLPQGVAGLVTSYLSKRSNSRHNPDAGSINAGNPFRALKTRTEGQPMLKVTGVSKSFGGVDAVQDLSLIVEPGTIHSIIGPNGAGKSTTVNLLTGFETSDHGTVELDGQDISGWPASRVAALGMRRSFQTGRVLPEVSVLDNVLLGAHTRYETSFFSALVGRRKILKEVAALTQEALELLEWFGISRYANGLPGAMSAGHQRFLEIARVLIAQPSIVLLDEPAAGLSTKDIEALEEKLRALREAGLTIVLIEHHLDLVLGISDTITVLDYGKVIFEGPPDQVRKSQLVVEAYLGRDYAITESGSLPEGEIQPV